MMVCLQTLAGDFDPLAGPDLLVKADRSLLLRSPMLNSVPSLSVRSRAHHCDHFNIAFYSHTLFCRKWYVFVATGIGSARDQQQRK